MAIEAQELMGSHQDNGRATAVDYPKVESFAVDVQHHRRGEPGRYHPLVYIRERHSAPRGSQSQREGERLRRL